jgi:hypothetical protein
MAARRYPSYSIELLGYQSTTSEPCIITLYTERLSAEVQGWWYTRLSPNLETTSLPAESENKPFNTR